MSNGSEHGFSKTYHMFVQDKEGTLATGLVPRVIFLIGLESGTIYQGINDTDGDEPYVNYTFTETISSNLITGGTENENLEANLAAGKFPGGIYRWTVNWETFDPSHGAVSPPDKTFWLAVALDSTEVGGYVWNDHEFHEVEGNDSREFIISSDDVGAQTSKRLLDIEMGGWEIKDNHLVVSEEGQELVKYGLYDSSGVPTNTNVYKRVLKSIHGQNISSH